MKFENLAGTRTRSEAEAKVETGAENFGLRQDFFLQKFQKKKKFTFNLGTGTVVLGLGSVFFLKPGPSLSQCQCK